MDVARYEFSCQKAFHLGLQYARSLGHQLLEVEHVALGMLRSNSAPIESDEARDRMLRHIQQYLAQAPRFFGAFKIEFGRRLNLALDKVEAAASDSLVNDEQLWSALCKQSTIIQTFLA